MDTPPLSITTVWPKWNTTGQRVYLSEQRRPVICYGFDVILNDPSTTTGVTAAPVTDGFPPAVSGVGDVPPVFLTLREWRTLQEKVSRYPCMGANVGHIRGTSIRGVARGRPFFATAPFLLDMGASSGINAGGGKPRIGIAFYYTPADPLHLELAGLTRYRHVRIP